MTKREIKKLLIEKSNCRIQHTGWPCGTCFFSISKKLDNKDWQTILALRGDYKKEELHNLPTNIDKRLERIIKIYKTA